MPSKENVYACVGRGRHLQTGGIPALGGEVGLCWRVGDSGQVRGTGVQPVVRVLD